MNNENEEQLQSFIELENYLISFIPSYTGFLYIEADSANVHIKNICNITFNNILSKFYIESGTYVVIQNPINLKKVKFEKFTQKEQKEIRNNDTLRSELLVSFKKNFGNKK